jgi:hypothetical protein
VGSALDADWGKTARRFTHSSRRTEDHCAIFDSDGSDHRLGGRIKRSWASKDSRHRSMLGASTYQTQELVARLRLEMGSGTAKGRRHRPSSVGCSSQRTSRSVRTKEGRLGDNLKAPNIQKHFCAGNPPYALLNPCNILKSQEMRPPSERTKEV